MSNKKKVITRSSISGQFVKKAEATKHPKTTEKQHVNVSNKKKK